MYMMDTSKNRHRPLTVVILAAGLGTRLLEYTKTKPKALLPVNGKPIIEYSIAWSKFLGATKIIVAGGYMFDTLKQAVKLIDPNVVMVENKEYATTQRLTTLMKAEKEIVGGLLVFDGDYIYHRSIAEKISPYLLRGLTIFGTGQDSNEVQLDMRIKVDDNNRLLSMSKGIGRLPDHPYYFNSITYCDSGYLDDFFTSARETIKKIGSSAHVEDALFEYVNGSGKIDVVDLGYPHWIEIDNPTELAVAEFMVSRDIDGYFANSLIKFRS